MTGPKSKLENIFNPYSRVTIFTSKGLLHKRSLDRLCSCYILKIFNEEQILSGLSATVMFTGLMVIFDLL